MVVGLLRTVRSQGDALRFTSRHGPGGTGSGGRTGSGGAPTQAAPTAPTSSSSGSTIGSSSGGSGIEGTGTAGNATGNAGNATGTAGNATGSAGGVARARAGRASARVACRRLGLRSRGRSGSRPGRRLDGDRDRSLRRGASLLRHSFPCRHLFRRDGDRRLDRWGAATGPTATRRVGAGVAGAGPAPAGTLALTLTATTAAPTAPAALGVRLNDSKRENRVVSGKSAPRRAAGRARCGASAARGTAASARTRPSCPSAARSRRRRDQ